MMAQVQADVWIAALERFGVPAFLLLVVVVGIGYGIAKVVVPWGALIVTTATDSMKRTTIAVEELTKALGLALEILRRMERAQEQDREILNRVDRHLEVGRPHEPRTRKP